MLNNKKRKQEECSSSNCSEDDDGGLLNNDDPNVEAILFRKMTSVNSELISLVNNVNQVNNYEYFWKNSGMIDEFVGNIHELLTRLEFHRKKLSFNRLNSDILLNIYQFLNTTTLKDKCGRVSKMWRDALTGLNVEVVDENIDKFLNSSLVKGVNSLKLFNTNSETYESLAISNNLHNLKSLVLSGHIESSFVEWLVQCNFPSLTELNFVEYGTILSETGAKHLFSDPFMSNIKKLHLGSALSKFSESFFESFAESGYLNQITHLKINRSKVRMDLLLQEKVNLNHLEILFHNLNRYPNLLTNGSYTNLESLDISYCKIANQEFVNIMISPSLPKLKTLKAKQLNKLTFTPDESVIEFPPNSQSSITDLDLRIFNVTCFPSMFDHCPKLKRLCLTPSVEEKSDVIINMMKSPNLSSLEYLRITCWEELLEIIFNNRIYSNLKHLHAKLYRFNRVSVNLVASATTNLRTFTLFDSSNNEIAKKTPNFSNLQPVDDDDLTYGSDFGNGRNFDDSDN